MNTYKSKTTYVHAFVLYCVIHAIMFRFETVHKGLECDYRTMGSILAGIASDKIKHRMEMMKNTMTN